MIVEYKFHRTREGKIKTPPFIINGGHFRVGNKYVGIAANDGTYIPSTLVVMNRASLITKLTNIGYTLKNTNNEDVLATAEEIETDVDNWISKHDI